MEFMFCYSRASRSVLGRFLPSVHWVTGAIATNVKLQGFEIAYQHATSSKFKSGEGISLLSHKASWIGIELIEYGDRFAFCYHFQ
jgi:hypothetical protein